ncbi:MAG: DegT/DnrJ/EryC1/StrS family aminotransferase [Planctomycetes bacterium]|nr:DegT/DnrJ/EryC1/StrS family aminotransferase [Planctomycetota bacterium]
MTQKVPLLDLRRQYQALKPEIGRAMVAVAERQEFILGSEVEAFEGEVGAFLAAPHAIGCASGTDALLLALQALGVGAGDEVIVPDFTFIATATAVSRLGARPVFVEVDPGTLNIDPAGIDAAVTSRTRAVIPVHLYGQAADLAAVLEVARRRRIAVVEDVAQAFGGTWRGRRLGAHGHMSCYSFFPSKNLGAFGDAGLVTTADPALADRVRRLRVHGASRKYEFDLIGMNSRLDALQAAVLRVKLPHVDRWIRERRAAARRYREALADLPVGLPVEAADGNHTYNLFTIRAPDRAALQHSLTESGIGTAIHYPLPLHLQVCFQDLGHRQGEFPVSERVSREVLSLPLFPGITDGEIDLVVEAVRAGCALPAGRA